MSLSSALNSALVGLDISSRRAQVVSENVSNVGREGFGKRQLAVSPISPSLTGLDSRIERLENSNAVALQRDANGALLANTDPGALWRALATELGVPGDQESLADKMARLEGALIDAGANPASDESLGAVARALGSLADGVNAASKTVQTSRQDAENSLSRTVEDLNTQLSAIEALNTQIQRQRASGGATARLEDQRAIALDRVSEAVAIRVLPRDFGAVAVISQSGQILLDGKAAEIGFQPAVEVTPDRTLGAGLNALTLNGKEIPTSGPRSLTGGRIEGLFFARDQAAPEAQNRLDAFATELVARFSGPTADPSLPVGAQGLFVDDGTGVGAADRLEVNPAALVDTWRIRDGLGAVVPNSAAPTGNLDLALSIIGESRTPADPILGTGSRSLTLLAIDLSSNASARASTFDEASERASARIAIAEEEVVRSGVDVDEEMRRLIEIEQNYAAAARVVEVVDSMMDRLSRI